MAASEFCFVTPQPPHGSPGRSSAAVDYQIRNLALLLDRSAHIKGTLRIHGFLLRRNLHDHPILSFKLHRSYSSLGDLNKSLSVFSQISNPNVYFYTSVIQTLILHRFHERAIAIYEQMLERKIIPNAFTMSSILKSCPLEAGKQIQAHAVKFRLLGELYVTTSMMEVYTKFADVVSAQKLFERMPERNIVSMTSMISCYSKVGMVDEARKLFEEVEEKEKDEILWNVMIGGYVQKGMANEGLTLFRQMLLTSVKPNEVTIVAALSACGHVGSLETGRWIHSYLQRRKLSISNYVSAALMDMYGKCGNLEDAKVVFESMSERDLVSWNVMIMSCAINGKGGQALELFEGMIKEGHEPTVATFVGVLHGCGHSGLINEGRRVFKEMKRVYGVEPKVEHYGCMVSLLGRGGFVEEAYEVIKDMEVEGDGVVMGALLGACRLHGEVELGREVADMLVKRSGVSSGTFVLVSNMLAAVGDWEGVGRLRSCMKGYGVEKEAGRSLIEVEQKVHEFVAGERRHVKCNEIYAVLEDVHVRMRRHETLAELQLTLFS